MTYADGVGEAGSRREEGAMSVHIVVDEQRRDRPRRRSALWVAAGRPHALCRSSSAMGRGISLVVARAHPGTPRSPDTSSRFRNGVLLSIAR